MRTRFLGTDFFTARSRIKTLARLHPLSLLTPDLPSLSPLLPLQIPSLDLLSLPADLDCLPIENALSQFLSAVVPRPCGSGESRSGAIMTEASEEAAELLDEGDVAQSRLRREMGSGLQFEVVEPDLDLGERGCCVEGGESRIHFEVPGAKVPLDSVELESGLTFPSPSEVAMSICSVEDIPDKFIGDPDCILVKGGTSPPCRVLKSAFRFPLFEASEIDFELDGCFYVEEIFSDLLLKVESSHGRQIDELVINEMEFLESSAKDILDYFSDCVPCKDCDENTHIPLHSMLDMDLIHLNDNMLLGKNSRIYPINACGDCSDLPCSIQLLEVQVFDFPSVSFSQRLDRLQIVDGLEMSEKMLKEDMEPSRSFSELIISSELALVGDTIKALPVPVICDDKALKGISKILGDTLDRLKPHPLSVFDGIYLDWHPLLEGVCNHEFCLTFTSMLEDVSGFRLNPELLATNEEIVAIGFDFLDDSPKSPNMIHCEEVPMELDAVVPTVCDQFNKLTELCENTIETHNEGHKPNINAEKVSFVFESMSQTNSLGYFLDARRGASKRTSEDENRVNTTSGRIPSVVLLEKPAAVSAPRVVIPKWEIEVHQINLSDHILCLVEHLQKSYLVILESKSDSRRIASLQVANDIRPVSFSRQNLLQLITETDEQQSSGYSGEDVEAFVALYAIKQLSYFLCFFGVHTAQLYLSNLMKSLSYLKVRLGSFESLIESACWKAEKQTIESHPSLTVIEKLLRSNSVQNGMKVLIVSERTFWFPLTLKLKSMKMTYSELKHSQTVADHRLEESELTNMLLDALLHSDCVLASYEHISASFPFNKFCIILEYGGPCPSSRVSFISPTLDDMPRLHFLTVKLENGSLPKAICEGFDLSENPNLTVDEVPQPMSSLQGRLNKQQILGILTFVPVEEKNDHTLSEPTNPVDALCHDESATSILCPRIFKNMNSSRPCPDAVVIVNTQNFKKNMLISRRSSYQKILAMEKGGVQVVEREINLPLDLIFSAAVCVVWYEASDIGDNTTATVEAPSIHMFVENVATNILMSLSFAFSSCILIFEGKTSFLTAIMDSSDSLYGAAASLDMNLQLFCSYTPESTDEIILSCIRSATKLNTGVFPALPESETLGESFLTRFPSINPLSAQAILSSGGMLVEYLEWSPERRIQAIGKYHVPEESISLFSTLCKFGEIGDSKSAMTECSSIDSEASSDKLQSQRKRKKFATSSCNLGMMCDEPLPVESLKELSYGLTEMPLSQSYQLRNNFNVDTEKKFHRNACSINEVVGRKRGCNSSMTSSSDKDRLAEWKYMDEDFGNEVHHSDTLDMMFNESLSAERLNELSDGLKEKSQISHSNQSRKTFSDIENKFQSHNCSIYEVSGRNRGGNTSTTSSSYKDGMVECNYLDEELCTEVLDRSGTGTFMDGKGHFVLGNTSFLQGKLLNEPAVRGSLPNRTFGTQNRTFPTSAEISCDMNKWACSKDKYQKMDEKLFRRASVGSNRDDSLTKGSEKYVRDNFVNEGITNVFGISGYEKPSLLNVKNPFLNATISSGKQGPSRTLEFLQRMKEKSRMHHQQQTLPCNTCLSCPGSLNNKNTLKRKSPSTIDSFRYQGVGQPNKIVKPKWRKRGTTNSSIEKMKDSSIASPTWTPIDKRARQNLSFMRNGNEKQSKLVWRSRKSPRTDDCMRKRFRDEG